MFIVSKTAPGSLDKYMDVRHHKGWLARVCRDRKRGDLVMYKWKLAASCVYAEGCGKHGEGLRGSRRGQTRRYVFWHNQVCRFTVRTSHNQLHSLHATSVSTEPGQSHPWVHLRPSFPVPLAELQRAHAQANHILPNLCYLGDKVKTFDILQI